MEGRFIVLVGVPVRGRQPRLPSGRERAPQRRWEPIAWVADARVADAMLELLRDESADGAGCVVPTAELTAVLGSGDAERIRDRLRNPTVTEVERARELERLADERLRAGPPRSEGKRGRPERRSGVERRSGLDRRLRDGAPKARSPERRVRERRSPRDRRRRQRQKS
jgi:hypothetical protein